MVQSGSRHSLFVLGCLQDASDRAVVFLELFLLGRSEVVYVVQVVPRCFLWFHVGFCLF